MTLLDWGQVIFLAVVVIVSIGGMYKVLFMNKKE
jgi:hypothetical protein